MNEEKDMDLRLTSLAFVEINENIERLREFLYKESVKFARRRENITGTVIVCREDVEKASNTFGINLH